MIFEYLKRITGFPQQIIRSELITLLSYTKSQRQNKSSINKILNFKTSLSDEFELRGN